MYEKEVEERLIGHDAVLKHIRSAVSAGRVSHAYLVEGAEGAGKKTLAGQFAMALLCKAPENGEPCGRCDSCRVFLSGNHPDMHYIRPGEKGTLPVQRIREELVQDMEILPYYAGRKIYIVERAHLMNAQAQNALLKILEEPPRHVIFLLTCENRAQLLPTIQSRVMTVTLGGVEEPPAYGVILLLAESVQSFLPTVRSRCVLLRLLPLPEEKVRKILTGRYGVEESTARACAALCGGSVGQALRLARSEDFIRLRERWMEWLSGLARQETWEVLARAKALEEDKAVIEDVLRMMQIWFRDLIILRETGSLSGCVCRDLDAKLESSANLYEIPELYRKIEVLEDAKKKLSHNVNYGLWSDWLLVELSRRKTFHQ